VSSLRLGGAGRRGEGKLENVVKAGTDSFGKKGGEFSELAAKRRCLTRGNGGCDAGGEKRRNSSEIPSGAGMQVTGGGGGWCVEGECHFGTANARREGGGGVVGKNPDEE